MKLTQYNQHYLSFIYSYLLLHQLQTAAELVEATKSDLKDLYVQLENFEKERFTKDTSVGQTMQRFPKIAKEVEQELKNHKYLEDAL